jgi:starch synthase (maltosyl-transferring)
VRDWNQPGNLKELIARVNDIRRSHPALQQNATRRFHATDNPALLWFSKSDGEQGGPDGPPRRNDTDGPPRDDRASVDRVFVVTNTDPHRMQHGWIEVPIAELGLAPDAPFVVEDLLDGAHYTWRGAWNYVKLDPAERMAHIFVIRGGAHG